jgi:GntR family transcriptional regulator, transcriptional repressor for pyruvate dehydrogenase complex
MNSTIAPRKTHEVVAGQLRDRILSGELKVGDRLPPEDELTEVFGIARTTLREALRVLESQGLITIRRGRGGGPAVTHPSLEPAALALAMALQPQQTTQGDLDAARRMIEPQVAGELARRHRADDLRALEHAIDEADAAAQNGDPVAFGLAAANVHETLMERSRNTTLVTISKLLHELVGAFYSQSSAKADQRTMRRAIRSYRKLVELIRAGDVEGTVAHWNAQMDYTISTGEPDAKLRIPPGR